MSTATEISRLQTARNTIRNKMIALGLGTSTDLLDDLADEIDGIANQGAVSATVQEGDTYTIPEGYHNGSGTVSGVAGGGNYTLQSKSVTPTKSQQSVTADSGYYGLSGVSVAAIPEAYQDVSSVTAAAGDVLATKTIVTSDGTVTAGTMVNNGAVNKTLDATSGNQTYTVPAGYHNGSGQVKITLETKSATPTTSAQDITPTTGKVLSKVTVGAIPNNYKDTDNVTATAGDVLSGKVIVTSSGEVTGSMPNNGHVSGTLDATTGKQTYTIPAGYHDGEGTVSITLEEKSTTPTTSSQNITPTSGKVLSKVTVGAIPAKYGDTSSDTATANDILYGKKAHSNNAGSATQITGTIQTKTASDLTASGDTVTVPSGYYASQVTKSVAAGTAGTPTATKGSVSNHSISVTPSVTNTTGYITGGTINGTAVTVTASELASGNKPITANGTNIDVVGYSTVSVSVDDSVFVVSLNKNTSTGLWEPDCTFAQVQAAYTAGKTITVECVNTADPYAYADGDYSPYYGGGLYYHVYTTYGVQHELEYYYVTRREDYEFKSEGLSRQTNEIFYDTSLAGNLSPSDVANGNIYFDATGPHEGTGSNAFVVRIGEGDQNIPWEPFDCTYSEVMTAYTAGKTICACCPGYEDVAVVDGFVNQDDLFEYTVYYAQIDPTTYQPIPGKRIKDVYRFGSNGITRVSSETLYDTQNDDAIAANVLSGKTFHTSTGEATGSMTNRGAVSKTLDATTNNQSYTVPAGYHNGSGTVSIVLEEKSATPSTSSQNITPTSGKVLSKVTVAAIPAKYGDTTGDDGVAANVLAGKKVHTIVNGTATQITGSMANNGAISGSIDGLTTTSYSVPAGYTSGGTVSLTNDIELALAAI